MPSLGSPGDLTQPREKKSRKLKTDQQKFPKLKCKDREEKKQKQNKTSKNCETILNNVKCVTRIPDGGKKGECNRRNI